MTRLDALLSRILIVFISLLFTIIIVESAANYYLWNIASEDEFNLYASINQVRERYGNGFFVNKSDKRRLIYSPHHYIGYMPTIDYQEGANRHNSLGYRGEETTLAKPEGIYRIVALGESTTYGTEVEDYRDAYPYKLEEYLHDQGYDYVEVINAGVGGYTSYETFMNLIYRVHDLQPNLVVSYQGLNDIHTRLIYPYEFYRGDNSGYRDVLLQNTSMPSIWEYSTALRIIGIINNLTKSHSAVDWKFNLYASYRYDGIYKDQFEENGEEPGPIIHGFSAMDMMGNNPPVYFERNLRNFVSANQLADIETLFVSFISTPEINDYTNSLVYQTGLSEHNQIVREIAVDLDIFYYDFASEFPIDIEYYADGRHMTAAGNALRGQYIGDYIIENIFEVELD